MTADSADRVWAWTILICFASILIILAAEAVFA